MLYLYDNAIVNDLKQCFNDVVNPCVSIVPPENVASIIAQVQEDKLSFPIVALTRNPEQIDSERANFTAMHRGVATVMDTETNDIYYEKVIPIKLSYNLTVLTTNTADMDEMVRELLFKYINMYYLTINLPYEADRKIRFGISIPKDEQIDRSSTSGDYLQKGTLYQSIIPLNCEGVVSVTYTPVKLKRTDYEIKPVNPI